MAEKFPRGKRVWARGPQSPSGLIYDPAEREATWRSGAGAARTRARGQRARDRAAGKSAALRQACGAGRRSRMAGAEVSDWKKKKERKKTDQRNKCFLFNSLSHIYLTEAV